MLLQGIDIKTPQILGDDFFQMMEKIWSAQRSRGHVSRSVEEVESESQKLKAQMASEIDATIHLQEECREKTETSGRRECHAMIVFEVRTKQKEIF